MNRMRQSDTPLRHLFHKSYARGLFLLPLASH